MKKTVKRVLLILLCAVIAIAVIYACSLRNGETLDAFLSISKPQFSVSGTAPYQYPEVSGVDWAEEANQRLAAEIAPTVNALTRANADGEVAHLDYIFTPEKNGYTIGVYINSSGNIAGSMHIVDISLSRSGRVEVPDFILPEYLYDGDFLLGAFALTSVGLDVPDYGEYPTFPELSELLIDFYEAYTGSEVDTSAICWESDDEVFKKAVAMGFCVDDHDYYLSREDIYLTEYARLFADVYTRIYTDMLGRSSTPVSYGEFADTLRLFFSVFFEDYLSDVEIGEIVSSSDSVIIENPAALTRNDAACIFNTVYANGFRPLREPSNDPFSDYVTNDALTAYEMSFMSPFPSSSLFSGDYKLHGSQLGELVRWYADSCFWDSMIFELHSVQYDSVLSNNSTVSGIGLLSKYLSDFSKPEQPMLIVDNSRPYEWYYTQFNTGEYSSINCMPTISAMAITWSNPEADVSVEALRNLFLEENDSGWYMSQVIGSIEYYNIPYTEYNVESDLVEKLVEQLTAGHIILCQMSEAPDGESGHCFVIYGFRKLGDSIQFMVHDPCIYDGVDEFGKRPGKAMLLDSEYVRWVIERIAYDFLSIG